MVAHLARAQCAWSGLTHPQRHVPIDDYIIEVTMHRRSLSNELS